MNTLARRLLVVSVLFGCFLLKEPINTVKVLIFLVCGIPVVFLLQVILIFLLSEHNLRDYYRMCLMQVLKNDNIIEQVVSVCIVCSTNPALQKSRICTKCLQILCNKCYKKLIYFGQHEKLGFPDLCPNCHDYNPFFHGNYYRFLYKFLKTNTFLRVLNLLYVFLIELEEEEEE